MTFSPKKRGRAPRAPQSPRRTPESEEIAELKRAIAQRMLTDTSSDAEIVVACKARLSPAKSVNFASRPQEKGAYVQQTLVITRRGHRLAIREELYAPECDYPRTMSRYLTFDGMSEETALQYLDALAA